VAYSYDAYGNLTNDGVKTYAYDAENRLISVSDGASNTILYLQRLRERSSHGIGYLKPKMGS
jgi:hypothetical protein